MRNFDKGEDYSSLKKSFVIFICTYDPLGKDLYKYTFEKQCQEDPTVFLKDEATSIVLNCAGHIGDINDELKALLHYMAGQEPQGGLASEVAKGVTEVQKSEKWRREYMTLAMKFREERQIADLTRVISIIRSSIGKIPEDTMQSIFNIEKQRFDDISELITLNPNKSDEDIAEEMLGYTDD